MLFARSVAEHGRRSLVIAVLAWAVLAALVVADRGGAARLQCSDAVLQDWTAGRLGDEYPSDCYEAAIDALPEDLRAYTTAADDIRRAQISASRVSAQVAPVLDGSARQLAGEVPADDELRAVPAEVVVLGGLLGALAAAGIAAAVARRRRGR